MDKAREWNFLHDIPEHTEQRFLERYPSRCEGLDMPGIMRRIDRDVREAENEGGAIDLSQDMLDALDLMYGKLEGYTDGQSGHQYVTLDPTLSGCEPIFVTARDRIPTGRDGKPHERVVVTVLTPEMLRNTLDRARAVSERMHKTPVEEDEPIPGVDVPKVIVPAEFVEDLQVIAGFFSVEIDEVLKRMLSRKIGQLREELPQIWVPPRIDDVL